jgi:hypothetical protein
VSTRKAINYGNCRGISLLFTKHKISFDRVLSRSTPHVDEIAGDNQCGFASNKSATDQLFCIQQILLINWEFNGAVHKLFVDQHTVRLG